MRVVLSHRPFQFHGRPACITITQQLRHNCYLYSLILIIYTWDEAGHCMHYIVYSQIKTNAGLIGSLCHPSMTAFVGMCQPCTFFAVGPLISAPSSFQEVSLSLPLHQSQSHQDT